MRIVLFTGKGGVGKSTTAAATALAAARTGRRTLVMSTDAAHSLADAFDVPGGAEPAPVEENLWLQHVDAQQGLERSWGTVQDYLRDAMAAVGVDPLTADEVTVLPGAEEVLALLELRRQVITGRWDLLVVDCAPTAETLRLLALPEALEWYVRRILPAQRRVVRALSPVLGRAAGVPMPHGGVFDALETLHAELAEVRTMLSGGDASVRIVMTPERVVLAESRKTYALLSLYGYRVDEVVVNRIFPSEGGDPWRARWVAAQREVVEAVQDSFAGTTIRRSPFRGVEPVGRAHLAELAGDLYGADDPVGPALGAPALRWERGGGATRLRLALPGVDREEVRLARRGDELVVDVGSYRRLLTLPPGLARLEVGGARMDRGDLEVRFRTASQEDA